jgi:phosphatidate cytidylyltransferase
MKLNFDRETGLLIGGTIALLVMATLIGWWLGRRTGSPGYQAAIANVNARTRAWWVMVTIFVGAILTGGVGSVVLFGLLSFFALREFITMAPTRAADHRALFWIFFIITPLQY